VSWKDGYHISSANDLLVIAPLSLFFGAANLSGGMSAGMLVDMLVGWEMQVRSRTEFFGVVDVD
jgi:hypothetical protein